MTLSEDEQRRFDELAAHWDADRPAFRRRSPGRPAWPRRTVHRVGTGVAASAVVPMIIGVWFAPILCCGLAWLLLATGVLLRVRSA